MPDRQYLWVNLTDLTSLGRIGPFGSPLNMLVRTDLGDELLPDAYYSRSQIDDVYVIVVSSPNRCAAIRDALNVIAARKLGRKVRCRVTIKSPQEPRWVKHHERK